MVFQRLQSNFHLSPGQPSGHDIVSSTITPHAPSKWASEHTPGGGGGGGGGVYSVLIQVMMLQLRH